MCLLLDVVTIGNHQHHQLTSARIFLSRRSSSDIASLVNCVVISSLQCYGQIFRWLAPSPVNDRPTWHLTFSAALWDGMVVKGPPTTQGSSLELDAVVHSCEVGAALCRPNHTVDVYDNFKILLCTHKTAVLCPVSTIPLPDCLSSVAVSPFLLAVAIYVHRCRCRCRMLWLVGVDDWLASYRTEQRKNRTRSFIFQR